MLGALIDAVADRASNLGHVSLIANSKVLGRAGYTSLLKRLAAPGTGQSTKYISVLVYKESDTAFGVVSKFGIQQTLSIDQLERHVLTPRWPVKNVQFNRSVVGKIGAAVSSFRWSIWYRVYLESLAI